MLIESKFFETRSHSQILIGSFLLFIDTLRSAENRGAIALLCPTVIEIDQNIRSIEGESFFLFLS